MGNAVHGKDIGMEYPLMAMDQVKARLWHLSVSKKGETDSGEKPGKSDNRNLMKGDTLRVCLPSVGKDVDIVAGIAGDTFGQFLDEVFRSPHQTVLGNNNRYLTDIFCHSGYPPILN
jgi:hypothetical protein